MCNRNTKLLIFFSTRIHSKNKNSTVSNIKIIYDVFDIKRNYKRPVIFERARSTRAFSPLLFFPLEAKKEATLFLSLC